MVKLSKIIFLTTMVATSACVTQSYENNKSTPVIKHDASKNEMAMTRISLGLGYLKVGNTIQAKLNLEKAKGFAPDLVQVYTAFAHYYDTVDEPDLATEQYQQALAINPDDADTLNNFGVFLCKHQYFDQAEVQILKAIAVPSYLLVAQSYENLALCQLKAKNFSKAQLYLEKAIVHNPSNASSLLQMAQLYYVKADHLNAQKYIKRYEQASRRFSPNALALAYKISIKQGNRTTAKHYANMLVQMFPNSYEAQQYVINQLDEIEADRLAKEYRGESANHTNKKLIPKKVIVLSPTKNSRNKIYEPSERNQKSLEKPIKNGSTPIVSLDNDVILTHRVVQGDNLFYISKKYNIQMKSLEKWNDFERTKLLSIGDVIYLSAPKTEESVKRNNVDN
jgi:type IV pilus assembly protein PilF